MFWRAITELHQSGKRHDRTAATVDNCSRGIEASLAAACAWGVPFSVAFPDLVPSPGDEATATSEAPSDRSRSWRSLG